MVRGNIQASQELVCDRAGPVIVSIEPRLDALAIVGDAGGERDRILHQIEGDRAPEVRRDRELLACLEDPQF